MMTPIDERQPLLLPAREDADGDDANATGKHHQTQGGGNTTSKPAHAIKKVLLITLCICVLGFLACVSLASLNKTNSSGKTSKVRETHQREESLLERGREDGRGRTRDQPGWETVEEERFVSNRVRFFFCGDEFEQFFCFVVLE